MRIAVIGAGSWGTAVADIVAQKQPVTLWARRPELAEAINRDRTNPDYLPDHLLSERLRASSDLIETLSGAEAVVMGVPSHGFRSVLETAKQHISPDTPILSLAKGVERRQVVRQRPAEGPVQHLPGDLRLTRAVEVHRAGLSRAGQGPHDGDFVLCRRSVDAVHCAEA